MPITGITISAVEPFAEGKTFGKAGAYVRVRGVARGVLDPRAPENAGIVDLDKATRNKDRKSTRLNSSHSSISYAVFCLKKKKKNTYTENTGHRQQFPFYYYTACQPSPSPD